MIALIDDGDSDVGAGQTVRHRQTPETGTDYHHVVLHLRS
jgi:hypothetical protein